MTAEERTALRVAGVLARAVVWGMVVVGVWAQLDAQRGESWVLLWVLLATMLGSVCLDHLVRAVSRGVRGEAS